MNDIVDMAQFVEAKSDQLNSDDLMGGPRTITVTRVTGNDGDQPVSIYYDGDGGKPFKPCKTIRRVLLGIWGRYTADYVGRSMTIYRDDSVTFGGLNVGGIRISHMSHMEKETLVVVMKSKGKKAGIKVLPLVMQKADAKKKDAGLEAILATLKNIAQPGQMGALEAAWKTIGADARKALAAELPALKAACEEPAEDVPFDAETGEVLETGTSMLDQIEADPTQRIRDDLETAAQAGDGAAVERLIAAAEARTDLTDEQRVALEIAFSKARGKIGEAVG